MEHPAIERAEREWRALPALLYYGRFGDDKADRGGSVLGEGNKILLGDLHQLQGDDIPNVSLATASPQSRVRLFIVGQNALSAPGNNISNFEDEQLSLFYKGGLRPKKLKDFFINHPEIEWTFRELPDLPNNNLLLPDIVDNTPKDSEEWWPQDRVDYLINQTSEKHLQVIKTLKDKLNYGNYLGTPSILDDFWKKQSDYNQNLGEIKLS